MQIESSTRSTNRSFKKLILEQKASPEAIYETICNQTVDLVFTAHPTQVESRCAAAALAHIHLGVLQKASFSEIA